MDGRAYLKQAAVHHQGAEVEQIAISLVSAIIPLSNRTQP